MPGDLHTGVQVNNPPATRKAPKAYDPSRHRLAATTPYFACRPKVPKSTMGFQFRGGDAPIPYRPEEAVRTHGRHGTPSIRSWGACISPRAEW